MPQVLTPFHIIFHLMFLCSFSVKTHRTPSKSNRPRVQFHPFKGTDLENVVNPGQRLCMLMAKVKEAKVIGPRLLRENPPKLGADPLGLQTFSFFVFFIIFTFFNYCFFN